jgi:protein-tyrosine phosphatase
MGEALSRLNFRDLGGLPGSDGLRLRAGLLYRGEGPASFAAEHLGELGALGFRLVCDLRSRAERERAPNSWAGGARLLDIDINSDLRDASAAGWLALKDAPGEDGAKAAMRDNYRAMPAALLPHLRGLFEAIAAGETPVLIHCTAGKDRTGVLVALLLLLLGVPAAEIERDYMRSAVFAETARLDASIAHGFREGLGFEPDRATIAAIVGAEPSYLNAALDGIDSKWGGIDAYFAAAGIDADMRAALRRALLVAGEAAVS